MLTGQAASGTEDNERSEKSPSHHGRENSRENYNREGGYSREGQGERVKAGAMEVVVEHNIDKAMKILKRKLIKEGLFKELKSRRYYEKPSDKKKRKTKESLKKLRKEEARSKKNSSLM